MTEISLNDSAHAGHSGVEHRPVRTVAASWEGAFAVDLHDGLQGFRRLNTPLLTPPFTDGLANRAAMPAGVRAGWEVDRVAGGGAGVAVLRLEGAADAGASPIDVLLDGELVHRVRAAGDFSHELSLDPVAGTGGPVRVELYLPQFGVTRIGRAELSGPGVRTWAETGPRWLTYGSSITHCQQADGPSETWPSLIARRQGWRQQSLGFAGECQLDAAALDTIRRSPADLISVCLGINSYNASTFSERTWSSQVAGFLAGIRAAHPGVALAVITPVYSPVREDKPNLVGLTLADVRDQTAAVVRSLQAAGAGLLTLIDGAAVFSLAEAAANMPDGLHPDNAGYALMAARLAPLLTAALHPA